MDNRNDKYLAHRGQPNKSVLNAQSQNSNCLIFKKSVTAF